MTGRYIYCSDSVRELCDRIRLSEFFICFVNYGYYQRQCLQKCNYLFFFGVKDVAGELMFPAARSPFLS